MTHERQPGAEHQDGPEHDDTLPEATSIPTYDDPELSDAPILVGDLDEDDV